MSRILDPNQTKSERVAQAQARLEKLIHEQGRKPVKIENLQKHSCPDNDPEDNVLKMISEWRSEET